MKKFERTICVLLALVLCLGLAACGNGGSDDEGYTDLDAFFGVWKYDDYDQVFVINDDFTWDMYDTEANYAGSAEYEFSEGTVTLLDGSGNASVSLYYLDGQLTDSDGDTISAYEFVIDDSTALPSPADPLTQTISFDSYPSISVSYPELMEGHSQGERGTMLSFNAINEGETDERFTNINISLLQISGYDQYMDTGRSTAEQWMNTMLKNGVESMCGDKLIKYIGTDFVDGGSYWGITGYAWMDSSIFPSSAGQPVRATIEIRYVGPTGYAIVAMALAIESRIQNYYEIAHKMIDTVTAPAWSTAPKPVPAKAGTPANGSDPGDYGTPYYWYDSDGDIWYWNGYENEFIGYGNNGYIDDGGYYENNDAGWDDSDYYDDYDPWSDAGDGDDFWSDPGDTGW